MVCAKQKIMEVRWAASERQRDFERKNDVTRISINSRKETDMEEKTWSDKDLAKLEQNLRRPMNELISIFKGKFTSQEINAEKSKLIELQSRKTKMGSPQKYTPEIIEDMYRNRHKTAKQFLMDRPDYAEKFSYLGFQYIYYSVRQEIAGTDTGFSQDRKALLDRLVFADTGKHIEWKTATVRAKARNSKNKENSDTIQSAPLEVCKSVSEELNKESEIAKDDPKNEKVASIENTCVKPDSSKIEDGRQLIGIIQGDNILISSRSRDYINGAFEVYTRFGFRNLKKVNISLN